ncbi:MAG: DUF4386 domain-containing protein [Acidobacteria bacterium]|nr:DUF4386 domain-containing protein [Acidobacteriota bacterium]
MSTIGLTSRVEPAQQIAAKVAGFLYLFTMAISVFSESYVRGRLIVRGDAVQTAKNIVASERLFRISVAADLFMIAGVVVLVWTLYVVLKPINSNVALLAAFLRLVGDSIAAATIFNSFVALRLLSGADFLQAFDTEQMQVLARLFISGQGAGMGIAFLFLGLGSTVFSYLWFKSRYIPRALAAWGIFSSLLLAIGTLLFVVYPGLAAVVGLVYMVPMGIYEVGLGLWLLVKGIQPPIVESMAQ